MVDQALMEVMRPERDYWPTDGWREADPDQHGLDPAALDKAHAHLLDRYPNITSLLVVRGGWVVYERYMDGGPEMLHNVKSVAKSVLSALVGIALKTGDLASLDEQLGYIFPARFSIDGDPRKREITIRDLLTMRAGLAWAEWGRSVVEMTSSPNWFRHVLDRPLADEPGCVFNYSTGATQLLSAMLQDATGMSALEFADMALFKPLGITRRAWPADPQGVTIGGAELQLTARDMAKLGYLYLNAGRWADSQIVPVAWVRDSFTQHVRVTPDLNDHYPPLGYGYLWWLRPQAGYASAMAVGYGGQYIYVIPALDLCVVMTGRVSDVPEMFADNRMIRSFNVVEDFIVPAAGADT